MTKIAIHDTSLRAIQPPPKGQADYWDDKLPSFGVRVSQGGSKTFVLKLRNTRVTLGRYGIITLSEARNEAKRLLAEKTLGRARPRSITFPAAFDAFIAEKEKSRRARTIKDYRRIIPLHFPFKGQLSDISHADIERRLNRIKARSEYDHALQNIRSFFNWCHKRRYITDNPTTGFSQHTKHPRTRVLSDDELKSIWRACEEAPTERRAVGAERPLTLPTNYATIVKLLILTGQRKTEIASLQTSWINENSITLPATITKNGREHTLPVGFLCQSLLASVCIPGKTGLIFPARGSSTSPFNGWSKAKVALHKACSVNDWTLHDLRRTFRTIHAKIGTPSHVAERLVNHISAQTDMERVYNQHRYEAEMREAINNYEAYLQAVFR